MKRYPILLIKVVALLFFAGTSSQHLAAAAIAEVEEETVESLKGSSQNIMADYAFDDGSPQPLPAVYAIKTQRDTIAPEWCFDPCLKGSAPVFPVARRLYVLYSQFRFHL